MVDKRIKFLIVTLVVAVVAVSGCTQSTPQYEEQNDTQNDTQYRMEMMDEYAKKGYEAFWESHDHLEEAAMYFESYDVENAAASLAASKECNDKAIQYFEEAYNYAEGPYKECIEMLIDILKTFDSVYDCYDSGIDALYAGDYEGAMYYIDESDTYLDTIDQKIDELEMFLEEHPDVQEHIKENWT